MLSLVHKKIENEIARYYMCVCSKMIKKNDKFIEKIVVISISKLYKLNHDCHTHVPRTIHIKYF